MLFSSCQNKDGITRRLLESFQKIIKRRRRQHVHLIDDIHFVFSALRRESYLIYQIAYIIHTVIRCRVQFKDIERRILIEGNTGVALAARFKVRSRMFAVDCFCQNTGASGFSYATRAAKQKRLCQFAGRQGFFQRFRHLLLSDHIQKPGRAVFAG